MNLSSGGLAILAIAAIWFLVFLPSFVKGDKAKIAQRETVQKAQEVARVRLGEKAQLALSARRGRSILAVISIASFIVGSFSVLEVSVTGGGLPLAIASVAATATFTWLTVRSNSRYRALLSDSVRRTIPLTNSTSFKPARLEETKTNTWQPENLPKQSYLQTGAIEIVELAEVVELDSKPEPSDVIKIDEILQRRRHVG